MKWCWEGDKMKDIWDLGLTLSYVPLHQQWFKGHRFAANGAVKVPDPVPVVSATADKVSFCSILQQTGNIYEDKYRDLFMWIAMIYGHRFIHLLFHFKYVKIIKY